MLFVPKICLFSSFAYRVVKKSMAWLSSEKSAQLCYFFLDKQHIKYVCEIIGADKIAMSFISKLSP
jgi:hypothetical protein